MVASFKHAKEIYEAEKHLTVRLTGLNFATIYPTSFDKQKVRLTMNVFNDEVVTEFNIRGHSETARFAQLVCRMIKVLNVKHPETGKRLLDPDEAKFVNADDSRFDLLKKMVGMFKSMGNQHSRYPGRVMHLTEQTSNALDVSIIGIHALIKLLLDKGMSYCLPGEFQSNRIEGEFGTWRQMNGGNYYMLMDNIQSCMKLQRLKLFSKFQEENKVC